MRTRRHVYGEEKVAVQDSANKHSTQQANLNGKISAENNSQHRRAPIFEYPPLPEIKICLIITIATISYGWYCVFTSSQKWLVQKNGLFLSHSNLPRVGNLLGLKDETNWEWRRWSPFALQYLPFLILHSLLFNLSDRLIPNRSIFTLFYTLSSMAISAYIFTTRLVIYSIGQGLFIFACTYFSRKTLTVWLSSLPILYVVMNKSDLLASDPFLILLFVAYTLLSFISFNLELARGNVAKEYSDSPLLLLQRMLFYTFYQPYLFSLIVLYPEFERQLVERKNKTRKWGRTCFFAFRIAFWWILLEVALHFFYFSVITFDDEFAAKLPKNEFVSLGMAMGSFFHVKYVVIFGLPSVFALLDGMEPKEGPICIQRVSLYSKIWREFDRGLYAFFKTYIFIPICQPTFSPFRKMFGICVSFAFVLLWHGFQHQNIVWILLNIIELFIEFGSKAFYSIAEIRHFRKRVLTDVNFRRLLGVLQIIPFAFGLYSNFYFLGSSRIGWLFVERVFLEETVPIRWPFLLLIFLGYFFMQTAMEVERWKQIKLVDNPSPTFPCSTQPNCNGISGKANKKKEK